MLHQGAESPGVDGPVVDGLIFVEFGMDWRFRLEGEPMGGRYTVPAEDLGNEAALLSRAIVDDDLASFYCGDIVAGSRVSSGTGAEDSKQSLLNLLETGRFALKDWGHTLMYIIQKNFSRYCKFPSKEKREKNLLAANVKET